MEAQWTFDIAVLIYKPVDKQNSWKGNSMLTYKNLYHNSLLIKQVSLRILNKEDCIKCVGDL